MEYTESQGYNCNFNSSVMSPYDFEQLEKINKELFGDDMFSNNATNFELDPDSRGQPDDTVPDGVGNPNANELSKQFNSRDNSQRDVEGGVVSTEPDPKHLDHAGQASNGGIQKSDEARMTPVGNANSQIDKGRTPCSGCSEKKRKNRQTPEGEKAQKQMKKQAADRTYRAKRKVNLNPSLNISGCFRISDVFFFFFGLLKMETELEELKKIKTKYDRLMERVSRYGGINQMESRINQSNHIDSELLKLRKKEVDFDMFQQLIGTELGLLQQMKSKYGGINEMKSMLDKFKELEAKYGEIQKLESILEKFVDIEADSNQLNQIKSMLGINEAELIVDKLKRREDELHKLDQIKSLFGGIDEIEPAINRLKTMGLQLEKQKQMVNQKEVEPFQASPGSLLVSDQCGINLNSFSTVSETAPTMQYSDGLVDRLIAEITDENIPSDLDTSSFGDLLGGGRESVGKYEIPSSLVSTARRGLEDHGDITKKCKLSPLIVNTIFVLFCAAIKEMDDVFLEDVNEGIIWKLRHPIMDARRSEFDTEFAMKRLTTRVHGYFGLKARQDRHNLEQWVARLRVDEETLRKGLEKKSQEVQDTEAKLRRLTSDKCKICKDPPKFLKLNELNIFKA
ncbi:hypothetical protein J1N35_031958 [Gossypium stocksii]|uniref:BZIP domain-containing protein n=1 Tax=Gossypium stocksii TaxID=47602 RepID=A0A9D3V2U5_9ROSI|nr:hypothetical protein J1N35_031958 [Gossypium stocksii]